ncbi:unnamed protein product [Adineta steineri]|uniref:Nucleotide exchange factor SIL1 n=1 Tax=Adineta steineri TaxID=433720 RepID=A0A814KV77_9BILA|nr:unnamed protein product [Adineta steineri]CAF1087007.1 unnamed protein product [Adineta steineri]
MCELKTNLLIKKNFNCKKCNNYFKHEEHIALFKQHQYHFHCFLCLNCKKQLSHESFYFDENLQLDISNPQVYCEICYLKKRYSSCLKCNEVFTPLSIIIEFQGEKYHNECFICSKCEVILRNQIFYLKNNFLYCHSCMNEIEPCIMTLKSLEILNDYQCKKCKKNFLEGETISMYENDYYHSDCFRCENCEKLLIDQGCFRQENEYLYCLNCHIDNGPHCTIFVIISLTCGSLSSNPIRTQQSDESFVQNKEQFIPTNEWQNVKEGQAVPPGLHVRLNLETGAREAKLLDNDNKEQSSSNDMIPLSTHVDEQERISKENLERAFANLDFTKDDVKTDQKHEDEVKAKFRGYDELKKDFESMNMKVQTDQEILTDLMNKLRTTDNNEDRKTILTDLEYYLHQYDNAIFFADNNGLELLMQLLNTTNTNNDVRHFTSLALGAAFQGNPKVQSKGFNLNFVPYLLRLLNIETDNNIKFRLLFTLSTLLRNYPQAQMSFVEHGGIETIVKIFDETKSHYKLQMRTIELMGDLIAEKDSEMDDKRQAYENIHIRAQLIKHNWCASISHHFSSTDFENFDHIEKIILAMIPLTDACRTNFVSLLPTLDKLNDVYQKKNLNEDSTFTDLITNIQHLQTNLKQITSNDL